MRLPAVLLASAVLVSPAVLPVTVAHAAKRKPVTCKVKGGTTVARHGEQRLITFADYDEGDDIYGPAMALYACRQAHRPAVRLLRTAGGTSLTVTGVRFSRWYVVFSASGVSSQCSKYEPDNPDCVYATVSSYDLRTGRRKASTDGSAAPPFLSTKGWFAWVTPPDTLGARSVIGVDAAGAHTLDHGAIDPTSLDFFGARLGWLREDGTEQSAVLG